jgi:hypothetical protein
MAKKDKDGADNSAEALNAAELQQITTDAQGQTVPPTVAQVDGAPQPDANPEPSAGDQPSITAQLSEQIKAATEAGDPARSAALSALHTRLSELRGFLADLAHDPEGEVRHLISDLRRFL